MVTLFLIKEARIYNAEKTASSVSGAGKTGHLHAKESNCITLSHHAQKRNSKWIKDLNIRPETIKPAEENTGSTFFDTGLNNIFFAYVSSGKEGKAKINQWDLINLKSYCTAKETTTKMQITY